MPLKTINGVTYRIISPSFWELAGFPVDLSFLGDQWLLTCPGKDGEKLYRYFSRRDEACLLVEQAFASL